MDTPAKFFASLGAILITMGLGFIFPSFMDIADLIYPASLITLLTCGVISWLAAKKIRIVEQYGTMVGVEPTGESRIFVRAFNVSSFIASVAGGVFIGALYLLVASGRI